MEMGTTQKYKEKPIEAVVKVTVSSDLMQAEFVAEPPKYGGAEVSAQMIDNAVRLAKVTYGINVPLLENAKKSPQYNKTYVFAKGTAPKNGTDGKITYCFQTTVSSHPKVKQDGTVDYRDLGIVRNVTHGQQLAEIVLPTPGVEGMSVTGKKLNPTAGRSIPSPVGRNTELSPDGTKLIASIDGHVSLNGSRINVLDTFNVSNDVGTSTGNIKSVASVTVLGSVQSGFNVEAAGNIEIGHNVEGGMLTAGDNITIHGGVVGMNSSKINAKHNVSGIFFENCEIVCGGSVKTESLMNCSVKCGEKLELYGMRAKIVGGRYVVGGDLIANEIGSFSNIPTQVILGADPMIMTRHAALQNEIRQLNDQIPKLTQIVELLSKFVKAGQQLPYSKRKMLQDSQMSLSKGLAKLKTDNSEFNGINEQIQNAGKGKIICRGTMYRGVKLTIGFASMIVENDITCSSFALDDGKIVVAPTSSY